jgi:hypothetical protein
MSKDIEVRIESNIFTFDDEGNVLYMEFMASRIGRNADVESLLFENIPYIELGEEKNEELHNGLMSMELTYWDILKFVVFPNVSVVLK